MKTAGGILLIIGAIIGLIGDVLLLTFGSLASHAFSPEHAHVDANTLNAIRSGIPAMQREAITVSVLAFLLLFFGVLAIRYSQAWPGFIALLLAVFLFLAGNHVSGILCLTGALLALFGSTSSGSK